MKSATKYFILFIIQIFIGQIFPQSYLGYYVIPTEYGYYEEITGGTVSTATGNDGAENITLPFQFTYIGVTYQTARISVNGWLEMGQTYTGTGAYNQLESTVKKPLICPLWEDLYADSQSEIRYKTIGEYPARYFVVQWKNILLSSNYRKSFQIRLWELDGTIDFIYGPGPSYQTYIDYFSVGMNNHIGGPDNFISITLVDQYSYTVSTTVANNMNEDVSLLTEGMMFSFVPDYYNFTNKLAVIYQQPDSVIVGNPNQKIFAIIIPCHAGNVLTPPWVTKFNFNTNGTTNINDIMNAKLFYTGSVPYFSAYYQMGQTYPSPNGIFEIGGFSNYLHNNGLSYYWLAYDISPDATVGNYVDANCFRIDLEGCCPSIYPDSSLAAARCVISNTGIQGNFTIGTGEDYENLFAAFNFLKSKILIGPVTLELTANYNPTIENYPVMIPIMNGSSAQNKITICPSSEVANITLNSNQPATLIFDGAFHVSLNGSPGGTGENKALSIVNENPNGSAIIITGNSKRIDIVNSKILGCNQSVDDGVIRSSYSGLSTYSDSISITNCFVGKSNTGRPANGIYFGSGYYLVAAHWYLTGCDITDFLNAGINFTQSVECYVQDSKIYLIEPSDKNKVVGITINPNAFMTHILRNSIYSLSTSDITPNFITGVEIPFTNNIDFFNNFISLSGNEHSTVTGIDFNGEYHSYNNFFNNSIFIYGDCSDSSNSYCFIRKHTQYYSGLSLKLLNNILINKRNNTQGTGDHYSIAIEDDRGLQLIDHNDYFVSGNGGILGKWLNNDISSLTDWKFYTQRDTFSISKNVYFESDNDLHLTSSSLGDVDLIGEPLSIISDDIDQETRHPNFPYIGADENTDYPLPVELISFSADVLRAGIRLNWITVSEINNQGFIIERNPDLKEWISIGFLEGHGTTTESHIYTFIDKETLSGTYQYRLKQFDYDGTYTYSNIIEVVVGIPDEFSLEQNYPNPFNPTTKIKYSLPSPYQGEGPGVRLVMTTLKVYDVLGNEVAILVNEEQPPGKYEVEYNCAGLSSGIYIYQLRAGNYSATRKMLLLK